MSVRTWMSPDPVTVEPTTDVAEARRLLHHYGIRHLLVVDRGEVLGVLSDRDVRIPESAVLQVAEAERDTVAAALARATGSDLPVESVMSAPPIVVDVEESIQAAARLMLSHGISALPVLEDGKLVGLLTTTDCLLSMLSPPLQPDSGSRTQPASS